MALDKDKLMASAQKLIQQNKLDKAIKELRRILEEDPKDIRVLQKLGDVHAKLGERAEAAKASGAKPAKSAGSAGAAAEAEPDEDGAKSNRDA